MINVGDTLPNFSAPNQDGKVILSEQLKGNWTVLYFYPKDNTPGCTQESCDFRDANNHLKKLGCTILGISKDSSKSHTNFISKYTLPFDLLSDVEGKICELFGVWVEKSMYGRKYMGVARTTFVIDETGTLTEIIEKVDTKNHASQIK